MAAQASYFNQLFNGEFSQTADEDFNNRCESNSDIICQPTVCTNPGETEFTYPNDKKHWFNSKDYQAQLASEKLDQLWEQLTKEESEGKVACQTFAGLEDLFRQKPQQSFNHEGDQMPMRMLMGREDPDPKPKPDRIKMVHQQGLVATGKFVPTVNRAGDYELPYTGIFESGSLHTLIRLSETGRIIPDHTTGLSPSIAFKFLRDGEPSANQLGKVHHGVEADNWNFFGNDFHSQLPDFVDNECGAKSIHQFNASVRSKYIFAIGTADTACYDEDGEKAEKPDGPYTLKFVPAEGAVATLDPDTDGHWIDQLEGKMGPQRDGSPTHLFDVYGMWGSPTDGKGRKHDRTPSDRPDDEFELLGKIETTSEFRKSLWGDEKLFFQHNNAKRDTKSKFGGDDTLNFGRHYLRFDFDEYGRYPGAEFKAPVATEDDVVSGIVANDCPFQWMLDALAALPTPTEE